jgi:hypothetical protein
MMVLGVAGTAAQEKVGKVSFATSCNAPVQADFDRAVAMLHARAPGLPRGARTGCLTVSVSY